MEPKYFTNPISFSISLAGNTRSLTRQAICTLFAFLLLAVNWGCGTAGKPAGFGSEQVPQIASFTATPATITSGDKSVLNWSVSGATSMSISTGSGNLASSSGATVSSNSVTVSPNTTTTYTLTATNPAGQSSTASLSVTVVDKPVINSFTASPSVISDTESTTLSYSVTGATNLSINQGVGDVTGTSSVSVSPTKTTTYLLTATTAAGAGSSSASVIALTTVTVVPAPVITNFTASPATISGGQSSKLSWSVSGATGVSIDHGIGAVTGTSVNVSPTATTTYTLTAGNTAGSFTATSTAQATVTFSSAAVPTINNFTVDHPSVGPNGMVKLTANFDLGQGGGTATITTNNGANLIAQGSSSPMTATLPVSSSTTFTLTAKNVDGNTATAAVRVLAGMLSVFAGNPSLNGSSDSPPRFDAPRGIAVDASGNIYVADTNNDTIRLITNSGGMLTVSTLAGIPQMPGNMDGDGGTALFNGPTGLTVDASGNVYVADTGNNTVRQITISGGVATVSTLMDNSTGLPAQFNSPEDVAVDSLGNVYVADSFNHTIDMVTPAGAVSIFAGVTGIPGHGDSPAHFNAPFGIAIDAASANLYVADSGNNTIRKIAIPAGVVSTLAGNATQPHGTADGTGAAALFFNPAGIAVDPAGNIYVADVNNNTIRRITPAGVVVTIVGFPGSTLGAVPGPLPASLGAVRAIAVDPSPNGNLYINMLNAIYTTPY